VQNPIAQVTSWKLKQ